MTPILVRDLLMNMLLGLTALVVLVLAQINPKADDAKNIPPPGQMAVSISWEPGPLDVDLWVTAPGETVAVGYSHKSGKIWSLLRDDLGTANDDSPINQENAFARETPAGEWVVNVHGFSIDHPVQVYVEVALGRSAEGMTLLYKGTVTIRPKEERTVIRFRLDGEGSVVPGSQSIVYRPLREAGK